MTMVTSPRTPPFLHWVGQRTPSASESIRILLAEDDHAPAEFVRKGLEAKHYAVDVSADREQARALATELDYDLIVLD